MSDYGHTRLNYFRIEELVHPDIYKARGDKSWELLDWRACVTLDQLRSRYGRLTVNDWLWGGRFINSGLRELDGPYAKYSQHKYGRAFDCKFADVSAEEVRQDLLNRPEMFPHITAIEAGVSWFHFDVRNCERIKVFNP